jgi:hypothetical protein
MTDEQREQVAYFASLHFLEADIALVTGTNARDPEFRAIVKREYLKREAIIRKSIFDLAAQGSSPAQAMALKLIETKKLHE